MILTRIRQKLQSILTGFRPKLGRRRTLKGEMKLISIESPTVDKEYKDAKAE